MLTRGISKTRISILLGDHQHGYESTLTPTKTTGRLQQEVVKPQVKAWVENKSKRRFCESGS
eukprot:scaffold321152_cov71-Attheya_sp.AAC.3